MARDAAGDEHFIGIEIFFTDTEGIGGKLRERFEDFIVREVSDPPPGDKDGGWTVAKVTATNWETNRLIRMLSRQLRLGRRSIRFAGTKDKRAVTTQLMAFRASPEALASINLKGVVIEDVYRTSKGIDIGQLFGNAFEIKVRRLRQGYEDDFHATREALERLGGFPNFFGVQRFGSMRPVTHVVGRHLVRGEHEQAVMAYLGSPFSREAPDIVDARKALDGNRDFREALRMFPNNLSFEKTMLQHLATNEGDFTGAIRALPYNLVMMFTHAYQGYLFNRIVSERIRRGMPLLEPIVGDLIIPVDQHGLPDHDKWFPVEGTNLAKITKQTKRGKAYVSALVFGTDTDFADGEMGEIERKVIGAEGLEPRDFIIPEVPEATSRGIRREIVGPVKDLSWETGKEDLTMRFTLDKGCYATSFLREYMKAPLSSY